MHSIPRCLFLPMAALVVSAVTAVAAEEKVTIGSESITIPLPTDYVRFDGANQTLDEMMQKGVPPTNRLLLTLAPTEARDKAKAGQPFELSRYYVVQTFRAAESKQVSLSDFDANRAFMKKQAEPQSKALAEAEASANKNFKTADFPVELKIGEVKSLGVFDETDRSLDFGMIAKTQIDGGVAEPIVTAGSIVLVRGKMTYLYVYANYRSADDVTWARTALKSWRESILAANQGGTPSGSFLSKFNWSSVWEKALIGGGIGLVIALFTAKKKKTAPPPPSY